jgi:hypothetical protein
VLLDSSWHSDFFPHAEQLKRDGVGIIAVIYDLIPLTHPQFYDTRLVKVFNEWFDWITRTADGYMAISTTVRDQVREELQRRIGSQQTDAALVRFLPSRLRTGSAHADAAVDRA